MIMRWISVGRVFHEAVLLVVMVGVDGMMDDILSDDAMLIETLMVDNSLMDTLLEGMFSDDVLVADVLLEGRV